MDKETSDRLKQEIAALQWASDLALDEHEGAIERILAAKRTRLARMESSDWIPVTLRVACPTDGDWDCNDWRDKHVDHVRRDRRRAGENQWMTRR